MDTSRVTLGDKIVAGAAIALIVDLAFLPWHQVFSFGSTALDPPGGWWGTLALLLSLAIVGLTAIRRFTTLSLPVLPRPIGEVNLAATVVVLALLLLKLALDSDYLGVGAYAGTVLAGVMVAGASLGKDETDEAPPVGSGRGAPPTPF